MSHPVQLNYASSMWGRRDGDCQEGLPWLVVLRGKLLSLKPFAFASFHNKECWTKGRIKKDL